MWVNVGGSFDVQGARARLAACVASQSALAISIRNFIRETSFDSRNFSSHNVDSRNFKYYDYTILYYTILYYNTIYYTTIIYGQSSTIIYYYILYYMLYYIILYNLLQYTIYYILYCIQYYTTIIYYTNFNARNFELRVSSPRTIAHAIYIYIYIYNIAHAHLKLPLESSNAPPRAWAHLSRPSFPIILLMLPLSLVVVVVVVVVVAAVVVGSSSGRQQQQQQWQVVVVVVVAVVVLAARCLGLGVVLLSARVRRPQPSKKNCGHDAKLAAYTCSYTIL